MRPEMIVKHYCIPSLPEEFAENPPKVVFVVENNQIDRVTRYEKHGQLFDI